MNDIMVQSSNPDWKIYKLGQVFKESNQKGSDKVYPPLSVTMKGIVPQLETAAKSDDSDNRKIVKKGDYVINSRSDRKGSGGISTLDGSVSLISIVLTPTGIHPHFAHHLLRSKAFQEEFYRWGHGIVADLWTTRYFDMKNIRLALPDLPTQRAIADFLDRETARIDLLIEKKEKMVEVLGDKISVLVSEISTGKHFSDGHTKETNIDWLGQVPSSWRIEKLSWHFYATKGKDAQKYTKEYCGLNEGEHPVYSGQTGNNGIMGLIDTFDYDFSSSGVLFATTVGAKAMDLRYLKGRFSLSQNCMLIIPRRPVHTKYFLYQLRSLFLKERQLIPDHMQASFRMEDLYRYKIAIPPDEHMSSIVTKLDSETARIDNLITTIKDSIAKLSEYRSSLITAAVTGQIDINHWQKSGSGDRRLDALQERLPA